MIKIEGRREENVTLAEHTSFRIGGPADLFVVPRTPQEVSRIIALCAEESVPVTVLGGGTNILVSDKGVRGVVMDLSLLGGLQAEGTLVTAHGGTAVSALAEFALARGLAGMEFAYALPGSVGGAVWMNARCYEREISDVLEFVDYLDTDAGQKRIPMRRDQWEYKVSPFQGMRGVILQAGFRLAPGSQRQIDDLMQEHKRDRERKGHFLFPCAGSVFKNNRAFGAPTGVIVDSLGLKGRRIGGAQVAPFHGNIIINTGGATARDVLSLIELVEDEVRRRSGFQLEREVLLVGEW